MNPHPIHRSHSVFDVESEIVAAKNCPTPVDLSSFQKRINLAVGLASNGKPKIRIVWGQDFEQTKMICFGAWRLRYPFYRYAEGGEIHDIGIPRFFVEELHSNAELNHNGAWDSARYSWIDGAGKVDALGPIPEDGFYTEVFQIAYHDNLCCGGREMVKGEKCLGAYREPNDSDLQRIRRMVQRREQASNDERAPTAELIAKRTADAAAKRDERWEKGIREVTQDFFRQHSWKFAEHDPTKLRHGRWHFVGSGHSKSGLSQDQIAQARRRLRETNQQPESNDTSDSARAA